MALGKPRVKVPRSAKVGDVVRIKTLMSHPMETGLRPDKKNPGKKIPRNIINTFVATFNGTEVFRTKLNTGISANPYLSFYVKVTGPGSFEFTWIEDSGEKKSLTKKLKVS